VLVVLRLLRAERASVKAVVVSMVVAISTRPIIRLLAADVVLVDAAVLVRAAVIFADVQPGAVRAGRRSCTLGS